MKSIRTILFVCTILISACVSDNNNAAIMGEWTGISWKIDGQDSGRDAAAVSFSFHADDTYSAAFSQQEEEGVFRLSGGKLYTTATGKAEKMVQIRMQGADTIIMDMNRVGTLEELVLVKN